MLIIAAAMAFYLAMIMLTDVDEFVKASEEFKWIYIAPVIALVVANYVIRSERWHFYLKTIGLGLPRRRSYWLFLSGLSMSVTPGKIGEALKAVLLKMERDAPLERGVGIVFVERMVDIIGMAVLIAIGAIALPYGLLSFAAIVVVLALIIVIVASEGLSGRVVSWMKSGRRLSRIGGLLEAPLKDSRQLLTGRSLIIGATLSAIAWACESVAFFLILTGISAGIGLLECVFIYAFASVVGAISMLPGGMGTTEATMVGLLLAQGAVASVTSFAVILTRVSTLWFAVALGVCFLALYTRRKDARQTDK